MAPKKSSLQRHCNIYEYIEDAYPDVHALLKMACLRENSFIPKQGGFVSFLVPNDKKYINTILGLLQTDKPDDVMKGVDMLRALIIYNKPLAKASDFSGGVYNALNRLLPSATAKGDNEVEFEVGLHAVRDHKFLGPPRDAGRPRSFVWILKGSGVIPTDTTLREPRSDLGFQSSGSKRSGTDVASDFGLEDIINPKSTKKTSKKGGVRGGNEAARHHRHLCSLVAKHYTPQTWSQSINVYHLANYMLFKMLNENYDSGSFASVANQILGIDEVTDFHLLMFYCMKKGFVPTFWEELCAAVAFLVSDEGASKRAKITREVYDSYRNEILSRNRPPVVFIPLEERTRNLKALVMFQPRCRELYQKYRSEYNTDELLGRDIFIVHAGYNKHKWITSGRVSDYNAWFLGFLIFKSVNEYAKMSFEHQWTLEIVWKLLISDILCMVPPLSTYDPPAEYDTTIDTYDKILDGRHLVSLIKSIRNLRPAVAVSGGGMAAQGSKVVDSYLSD